MISVEHVTKCYGDLRAVDDLSFEIEEGHVYGFLGANGAGKSTTMNMITGCLSATSGHIRIDGYDIFEEPAEAKRRLGYLPEQPPLYMNETPLEYLRFVGEAKGLRGAALSEQVREAVLRTGLSEVCGKNISALSKGYKQRVGIAQALIGNPKVIILDEPTVGLDPLQIIEIRTLIRELSDTHTVIFSSHILSEVQTICDRILMLAKGRLVAFDEPQNLEKRLRAQSELRLVTEAKREEAADILASLGLSAEFAEDGAGDGLVSARLSVGKEQLQELSRAVFFAFAERGKALLELSGKKAGLEDVFLELTEAERTEAKTNEEETEVLE